VGAELGSVESGGDDDDDEHRDVDDVEDLVSGSTEEERRGTHDQHGYSGDGAHDLIMFC
jgi:hypothetical protein